MKQTVNELAERSLGFEQHEVVTQYDHHYCSRCGWFAPDRRGRRGTAAMHGEWFPSRDAFEHFRRTGVRAWVGGSKCDEARARTSGANHAE